MFGRFFADKQGRCDMTQVNAKDILYVLTREFDLERENTDKRLVLQKTIYLLQAYGLKLGYGFSWYRYGPYSQDLVRDAYEVLHFGNQNYKKRTDKIEFNADCKKRFNDFKKICGDAIGDPAKLELIASVDFARTTWYPNVDEATFISKFKAHKNYLFNGDEVNDEMVRKALGVVNTLREKAA